MPVLLISRLLGWDNVILISIHANPDLEADFYILRRTLPPAVLVENFGSSPNFRG